MGKPYNKQVTSIKSDISRAINTIKGNFKGYLFLSDSGLSYQINDHKLFRYSVSTYNFMSSMVARQDLETYRKLFVLRRLWTEVDQYFLDFLDRTEILGDRDQ